MLLYNMPFDGVVLEAHVWLRISSDSAGYLIRSRMVRLCSFSTVVLTEMMLDRQLLRPIRWTSGNETITLSISTGSAAKHLHGHHTSPLTTSTTATDALVGTRLGPHGDNLTMYVVQKLDTQGRSITRYAAWANAWRARS